MSSSSLLSADTYRRSLIGVYRVKHVWTSDDYLWMIGVIIGGICIIFSFVLLVFILYNLWLRHSKQIDTASKWLTSLTIFTAFTSNCIMFTTYFVCIYKWCGPTPLGRFYFLATMDSYILSKVLLYSLLIFRIHNTYKGGAYRYPNYVFIILSLFLIFTLLGGIGVHLAVTLNEYDGKAQLLPVVSSLIYCGMDIVLGIVSMILFLKPLFEVMKNTESVAADDEKSKNWLDTIIRFIMLPLAALLSSTIVGILLVIRFFLGFEHAAADWLEEEEVIASISYLNSFIMLSIVDGFIAILTTGLNFKFGHKYYRMCCGVCHDPVLRRYQSHRKETMEKRKTTTQYGTDDLPTPHKNHMELQSLSSSSGLNSPAAVTVDD